MCPLKLKRGSSKNYNMEKNRSAVLYYWRLCDGFKCLYKMLEFAITK